METETIPLPVKTMYYKSWGYEPGNASAGFEFGRRDPKGISDWPEIGKWMWLANITSFAIQVWRFEVMFRFYHPNEWRFWALVVHPTRG